MTTLSPRMTTFATNGDAFMRGGSAVHLYAAKNSMGHRFFMNNDGDLLIVPQEGRLRIRTEFGVIDLEPAEIAVIQRGIKFQVNFPMARLAVMCARSTESIWFALSRAYWKQWTCQLT